MAELTSVAEASVLPRHPWVAHHPLTVADFYKMAEVGILDEMARVELIEGELIAMAPTGSDHSGTVSALTHALVTAVGDQAIVSVQGPIRLSDRTEPLPDFAILRPRPDFYRTAHAGPDDIFLLIEIAKSSLDYDREVKSRLYARAGIVEYWIANLVDGRIEVCRGPGPDGYASVRTFGHGASLDIAALPGIAIPSSVILG